MADAGDRPLWGGSRRSRACPAAADSPSYYPAIKQWFRMRIAGGFRIVNGGGDETLIGGGTAANTHFGLMHHSMG